MKKSMVFCGILCAVLLGCETDGGEKTNTVEPTIQEKTIVQETPTVEQSVVEEQTVVEEVVVEEPVEEEVVVEDSNENYKLNEKVIVEYNGGTAEVVFTNAYFTDYRNEFEEQQPDKVLVVEYTYTNVDFVSEFTDGLYFMHGMDYHIYDEDNFALETYAYYTDYGQTVSVGRSSKGSESFSVYGEQTHFEIELYNGQIVEIDLE